MTAACDTGEQRICGNQILSYVILEIFGLLIDLGMIVTPMTVVYGLHMQIKDKIKIMCVISAGSLCVSRYYPTALDQH